MNPSLLRSLRGGGAALLVWAALPVSAFVLIPISLDFTPTGRGATQTFRLENDSSNSVAVQVSIVTRVMDLDGNETNQPADDDFTVYPPQAVVGPKQSQAVRVAYLGKRELKSEAAYRIIAEQMPVPLTREQAAGGRINLVLRYLGTIYVVPKDAKPDVVLESVGAEPATDGSRKLVVVLHNRGNAHALIAQPKLHLNTGGAAASDATALTLEGEALKGLTGENVLAGQRRRFRLAWPEKLAGESLTGRLEFSPHR